MCFVKLFALPWVLLKVELELVIWGVDSVVCPPDRHYTNIST